MRWVFFGKRDPRDAAARFRAEHSAFLTQALTLGRAVPRIPIRPVSRGGFDPMMARAAGPERAAAWWSAAFARLDR